VFSPGLVADNRSRNQRVKIIVSCLRKIHEEKRMQRLYWYLASLLLGAALIAPVGIQARDRDNDHNCPDHGYYDRDRKECHGWDEREDRAYRKWEEAKRRTHREFARLKAKEQSEYWRWRHEHRDDDDHRDRH
jgi:hypothetical protein